MAWAWPAHKPAIGQLLDLEEWNDNITRFVQEADGNLNEHNIVRGTVLFLQAQDQTEDDLALRFWVDEVGTASQEFRYLTRWTPVGDVEVEFDSDGGQVLIIFSSNGSVQTYPDDAIAGAQFALELDGVIQPNSLMGSGDMGNEFVGDGNTDIPAAFRWVAGPGLRGYFPVQLKGTYRVLPGRHRVRPMGRFIHSATDASGFTGSCFNGELLVIHLWS